MLLGDDLKKKKKLPYQFTCKKENGNPITKKIFNIGKVKPNIPISSGGFLSLNRSHRRINVSVFSVVGHSPCLVIQKLFFLRRDYKFQQKV